MAEKQTFSLVSIDDIDLDPDNPRIRKFLEHFGTEMTPERFALALGAGGEEHGDGATTYEKLERSIMTNGGVIQPVILNRKGDGRFNCVEGNTRVSIYRQFREDNVKGDWSEIPALIFDNAGPRSVDAIRLQAHLVGPRQWDPYSKAKYLHHLRTQELMPFSEIVDYCGGREREINESINAYIDIEKYYRPLVGDGEFDTSRFSGFVELQKHGVKAAIERADFTFSDFAEWIHERKIDPLKTVRLLPRILKNDETRSVFLRRGAKEARKYLDAPDLGKTLRDASYVQLARALRESLDRMLHSDFQKMKDNPDGDDAQSILETYWSLQRAIQDLNLED
jgi:hypothetical protein